jgi:glycerate 2-kinase
MKILIACDSFKDALNATDVCKSIERGLHLADPSVKTTIFPLADGGEGTFDILAEHLQLNKIKIEVNDPLFRSIIANYGLNNLNNEQHTEGVAFIEMAQAAGLQLLKKEERNPLKTSTFGVGEMIKDAIKNGAKKIVLAIGGSATNDAGIGMAAALGVVFLDKNNNKLSPIGENLIKINKIITDDLIINSDIKFDIMCDVKNPLFGLNGAAYIYAKQKGATKKEIQLLDAGLQHFAEKMSAFNCSPFTEGAGAAGGLGFGGLCFLNAELKSGIDVLLDVTNFDNELIDNDLIITGEGKLDRQTAEGKLISGIIKRAKKANIPVVALCGILDMTPQYITELGLLAAFSINENPFNLEEALTNTANNLEKMAFKIVPLFN